MQALGHSQIFVFDRYSVSVLAKAKLNSTTLYSGMVSLPFIGVTRASVLIDES